MAIVLIAELVASIIALCFGIYVIAKNPRNSQFVSFAVTALGISGWTMSIFLVLSGAVPIDLPGRLAFSFVALLVVSFIAFVVLFPRPLKHAKLEIGILAVLGAIFFVIPLLPSFVKNIRVVDGFITGDLSPTLFPLWSLFYLVAFIFSLVALSIRTIRAHGVDRARAQQVLFGFVLFYIPQATTNLVLPLAFNNFHYNNLGPLFTLILLPFAANAILKYRLLDIRWIISKSVIFSAIIAVVVWILMAVSFLLARVITPQGAFIAGTFLVALVIVPLSRGIERWIGRVFERGGYDPSEFMEEAFRVARSEIDVNVIAEKMLKKFMMAFGAESGALIAFAPKSTRQIASSVVGFGSEFRESVPLLVSLIRRHDFELMESAELEWNLAYSDEAQRHPEDGRILRSMQKAKVDLLIPLVMEDRLVAFVALGERKYDRVLRQSDVNFVNLLRAGIAPAVENASKFAEMQELYAKLKESDIVKSQFIDTISHQFRTPLSSMRWNVETLLETASDLKAEEKEMLTEMEANAYFLIRTLTVFADVIQFESDSVLLEKTQFASSELRDAVSHHEAKARTKSIELVSDIKPATLVGDKKYIMRAIEEVMENAIEYSSEKAKVTLRVVPVDGKVKVEVTDTGIGMTDVDLKKRAFTKFYRGKNAILAHPDGIGLGLYLVKLITNKLGGTVSIDSELGKGTTVTMLFVGVKQLNVPARKPVRVRTRARAK